MPSLYHPFTQKVFFLIRLKVKDNGRESRAPSPGLRIIILVRNPFIWFKIVIVFWPLFVTVQDTIFKPKCDPNGWETTPLQIVFWKNILVCRYWFHVLNVHFTLCLKLNEKNVPCYKSSEIYPIPNQRILNLCVHLKKLLAMFLVFMSYIKNLFNKKYETIK